MCAFLRLLVCVFEFARGFVMNGHLTAYLSRPLVFDAMCYLFLCAMLIITVKMSVGEVLNCLVNVSYCISGNRGAGIAYESQHPPTPCLIC